ncbi:MAG: hypothetical protein RLZZ324_841, partial [Candidatus Parcubacteria bacterium]
MRKIEARSGLMVRWNPKKSGRFVQTAAFALPKESENRLGKVYCLVSADAAPRAGEALLANLEDAVARGALEAMRRCIPEATHEQLVEVAVSYVNRAMSRLLGENGIGLGPEYVSAALIAVRERSMAAAVWGAPTMLLFRRTASGTTRPFDMLGEAEPEAPAGYGLPRPCFGSVIAGPLTERDRVLVSSQDLRELIDDGVLGDFMAASDPAGSTEHIKRALGEIEDMPAVAVMAIDAAPVAYLEDLSAHKPISTVSSLNHLVGLESDTTSILSPSTLSTVTRSIVNSVSGGGSAGAARGGKGYDNGRARVVRETPAATKAAHAVPQQPRAPQDPMKYARAAYAFVAPALTALGGALWWAGKAVITGDWRAIPAAIKSRFDDAMTKIMDGFNGLPTAQRFMLFAALTAVFALNASVHVLSWKDSLDKMSSASKTQQTAAAGELDAADASLIYQDEDRTRMLLAQAATDIAALPEKKPADKAAKVALLARLEGARAVMRKVVPLSAGQTVATADGASSLPRLVTAGGALWSVSDKGDFYSIDPGASAVTAARSGTTLGESPVALLMSGKNVLAAASSGSVTLVPASGKGAATTARIETGGASLADAALWNGTLYSLDPAHNRILKSVPDEQGFAAPKFY